MNPAAGYRLRDAGAELAGAGLWDGALVGDGDAWRRFGTPDALPADAAFAGAGIDSRTLVGGRLFAALRGEHVDGRAHVAEALRRGAAAVLTRSWDGDGDDPLLSEVAPQGAVVLLSPAPERALAALAAAWRRTCPARLAAVTGSNGKTTTKDLLAALAGAVARAHATVGNLNNDLGLPLTLLELRRDHDVAVVELGASRAGDIDRLATLASPQVGVITNAAEAHLEGFGSLAEIVRTKGELLDHLPADGVAVLNADSPGYDAWRGRAPCRVASWGRGAGDHRWTWRPDPATGGGIVEMDGESFASPLPGEHNGANLVAALLAARALLPGAAFDAASLAGFAGSPHRNRILRIEGLTLLDDCYNANPTSMRSAAVSLADLPGEGRRFAVLGAMAELGPRSEELHVETGRALRATGVDAVWAVGPRAAGLARGFADAGGDARTPADPETAARDLAATARPGDRILFKGSRSAAVERVLEAFLSRLRGDLADTERP